MIKKWLACLVLAGCSGSVHDDALHADKLALSADDVALSALSVPAFADERGGGVFAADDGSVVRLRRDGSTQPLLSHPANTQAPGRALGVFPAGPYSALVATDSGLYVAEAGWLIAPPFRDALPPEGILGAALGPDGVVWIAHARGVFRLQDGALSELKRGDASLAGVKAIAAGPADDGSNGLWLSFGEHLLCARQVARTRYAIVEVPLGKDALSAGVIGLVSLSSAPGDPGELWLATPKGLFRRNAGGFRLYALPFVPTGLVARGRFAWLSAADRTLRYDADTKAWSELMGAPEGATLIAADPSGAAYLRGPGGELSALGVSPAQLGGLFEGARVLGPELVVNAELLLRDEPNSVTFVLDDGESVTRTRDDARLREGALPSLAFALGGFASDGAELGYDLAGLEAGLHTLTVRVTSARGELERRVHFELVGGGTTPLSYAADVLPIFEARCAKCHGAASTHPLATYERWLAEKDAIARAVGELRMPADGPLDPVELRTVQRWIAGGALP